MIEHDAALDGTGRLTRGRRKRNALAQRVDVGPGGMRQALGRNRDFSNAVQEVGGKLGGEAADEGVEIGEAHEQKKREK